MATDAGKAPRAHALRPQATSHPAALYAPFPTSPTHLRIAFYRVILSVNILLFNDLYCLIVIYFTSAMTLKKSTRDYMMN